MKKLILWHVAGWAFIFCFFITPAVFVGLYSSLLHTILNSFIYIVVFYVNLFFLLPAWTRKRKIVNLLLEWLLMMVGCTFITVLLDHCLHIYERNDNLYLEFLNAFLRNCLFVTFFLTASTTYRSITDWFSNEKIKYQIEKANLNIELALLKSQVNPQFLFNTLNNIYILAYREKAAKTAEAVFKLSEMMKYIVYDSSNVFVPVSSEIHYINQLMALQQLRMTEPMSFIFDISGDIENHNIAPLLLVPFFENVCKHAVLTDKPDPVTIQLVIKNSRLFFSCRNKIWQAEKDPIGGIGLLNVKRRLEVLYPGKYDFTISDNGLYYAVMLTVQVT